MLKIFYHKEFYINWCSELVLLYPNLQNFYTIDDKRFSYLKNKEILITYVDKIEDSDYVILPYKWRGFDEITKKIIEDVKKNNKKILVFFNDDSSENIDLNENDGFIFRTSFYRKNKKNNEYALPPFFDDDFKNNYIESENIELSIGFCGVDHYERKNCLNIINKNNMIKSNFIIRNGFWGGGINKERAINDFNKNIEENLFGFSCRGTGNFSYRFYQILSMGRIPVLLNTDCVLPFEGIVNYNNHCLIVDQTEINFIDKNIINFFNNKNKKELFETQKNNRKMYETFLSPYGFINNINKILKHE